MWFQNSYGKFNFYPSMHFSRYSKAEPSGFLEFWLLIVVIVTNNLYQLLINNLDKNGF